MGEAIAQIKALTKVILFMDKTTVGAIALCLDKFLALMEQCSPNPLPDVRWTGGVSNVDIDGNNAFQIKAIGVVISTFETLSSLEWKSCSLASHPKKSQSLPQLRQKTGAPFIKSR